MLKYILWALPKGEQDRLNEKILLSEATFDDCLKIIKYAESKGFHSFRIVELDNELPDFVSALNI